MSRQSKNSGGTAKKSAVPAVEKALDVLELLADAPDGLTVGEILESLGRTIGEVYRIIVYLTERGYLVQNAESNRYTLTLRLFEIAHRYEPTQRLIRRALPVLERIALKTEQSCHIGVLSRSNVLVLASVPSPRPAGYSVRTGAFFSVGQTSSGHVILAFSGREEREEYIANSPKNFRRAVRGRFKRICENGFEDTASTMVDGVRNLCVPIFDARGIVAAITCGFIKQTEEAVSPEYALGVVRAAGLDLSQSLGFRLAGSPLEDVLAS